MDANPYASFSNKGARAAFDVDPGTLTLRATFTLDRATLHRALRLYISRHRGIRWFINLTILVVTPLVVLAKTLTIAEPRHPIVVGVTFLVLALIALNSPPLFYAVTSLSLLVFRFRTAPGIFCHHLIEVKEGELVEATDISRTAIKLKAIANVYEYAGLLVIALLGGRILPIPESADFGADSFETFYLKLRAAVDAAKASDAAEAGR